jgi:type I restriction enzyme S subunit
MSLNLDKSTWKLVAFGDVIESITDRVDNPSEAGVDRYVGLEHLDPGVMTVQRWDSPDKVEAQKLRFQPGDVIFGRRRAYQKKVAKAEFEGICSAHALVLRGRPDYIDPDFLPVFISSDYFLERAVEISVGSLSPTVNWRDLKVQEFELPPLDEQKRIANLLWAVERHLRALATLQGAVEPDEAVDGLGRLLFDSWASGWPTVRFTDAIKVSSGAFLPAKNMIQGEIPVYGGNGVSGHHDQANFDAPVVMIGRVGAYCGAVHQTNGPSWVTDNALVVKRADGYSDAFLAAVLRHARLNQYASYTAQPAVSRVGLAGVEIARPVVEAQGAYLDSSAKLVAASEAVAVELAALAAVRSSLLADLFGGN